MLDFLKSKKFLLHLGAALGITVVIVLVAYLWLSSFTNHGETITVPNLKNMKYKDLEKFLADKSFTVKIADSSIFMLDKEPGTVVEQDPAPNEQVKEGRTIYVSIVRTVPPQVKLPNLVDVSQRQAEAILNSYGLRVGKLIYKPDLAKDAVLEILCNGRTINPGHELAKGSEIDLVLGDGIGSTNVEVPQLVSLTLEEAMFVLNGSSLMVGEIEYLGKITDTASAKVYMQFPEAGSDSLLKQGESINLFLKQN